MINDYDHNLDGVHKKQYQCSEFGISVQYPDSWYIKENIEKLQVSFLPKNDFNSKFKNNITINIQDISMYDIDLDKYLESSLSQLKQMLKRFTLLKNESVSLSGSTAHILEYSHFYQSEIIIFTKQIFTLVAKKVYLITFSCELDEWENSNKLVTDFISSFQVLQS